MLEYIAEHADRQSIGDLVLVVNTPPCGNCRRVIAQFQLACPHVRVTVRFVPEWTKWAVRPADTETSNG